MPSSRSDVAAAAERRLQQQSQTLWPGDHVRVCDTTTYLPVPDDHPWAGVWRVARVNPKTISIEQGARGGKAGRAILKKTDEPLAETAAPAVPDRVPAGALLRVTSEAATRLGRDITPQTLLVTLADKGDKINAARLGGDNDRYWRLPRAMLAEVVDPTTVLKPDAIR